jgi:hypothetical protein
MEEVGEITLPAFALDCRDWWVIKPDEAGLSDEVAGAPVLAVLSTAVVSGGILHSASAVLSLGLLDDPDDPADDLLSDPGGASSVLTSIPGSCGISRVCEPDSRLVTFVVPSPDGRLGLLAEFSVEESAGPELLARVDALMLSFRWAD